MCQAETSKSLTSPSKRNGVGRAYKALAENLYALGPLPRNLQLDRIDEGQGIEAAMVAKEAKWHQIKHPSSGTTIQRAEKGEKNPVKVNKSDNV